MGRKREERIIVINSTLEILGRSYPVEITVPNDFDVNNPKFSKVKLRFPEKAPDYYHIRREEYINQLLNDPYIREQILKIVRDHRDHIEREIKNELSNRHGDFPF
jgi:hypothetical protein